MQRLTVQAATHQSAQGLFSALSAFDPALETDDEGRCFVSLDLGSDRQVVEVLDAIQRFLASRSPDTATTSVVVAVDERKYTVHGT